MAFDFDLVGQTLGPDTFDYDWTRVALYALGCGATTDELDLVLETRGPKVLPSFAVVPTFGPLHAALLRLGGNMLTLVHGTQKIVMHRPIPPSGRLSTTLRLKGLYDKGKGALAILETETRDADGQPIFDTEWGIFYRGEGGFGGERGPETPPFAPPEGRAPSHRVEHTTAATQALLYRLGSGDLNPIHSDPAVAARAKFPQPILHGLCTFGYVGRAAVQTLCGGDPHRLRSFEGRFSAPVFPGETIVTELWETGPGEALVAASVSPRGDAVFSLGRVTWDP
jgi:acyl dehydratase